ncbi:VOC family protein [Microbacterium sp. Yaish 1]|uniref:VOC family protein n=1 Tax=Microbacterium sp. Yaish 1 TaxID=2025014 RepID=UPI000B9438F6|nr:VOC family protein [Microbacterium sp. Yaish 1]OYC95662.1 glyoxalase [Microbacterium sp. Yaish 1]
MAYAAHGEHTDHGTPKGVSSLTPFLAIPNAREAIGFYRDALGARVVDVTEMNGIVVHAVLDFGHGQLQIGEPHSDYNLVAPPAGDDDCYSLGLYVRDVDEVVASAEAAGAVVREPTTDFASGDRYASARDPFGVRWSIMTRTVDISEEESARRVAAWAASQNA